MRNHRFTALAALNLEGDPDLQKYREYHGDTLEKAVSEAEQHSVTGEAYQGVLERWDSYYHRWDVIEHFDIY